MSSSPGGEAEGRERRKGKEGKKGKEGTRKEVGRNKEGREEKVENKQRNPLFGYDGADGPFFPFTR